MAGVPHYGLVDLQAGALAPSRLGEQGYALEGIYGPGRTYRPELFPGLAIDVDALRVRGRY